MKEKIKKNIHSYSVFFEIAEEGGYVLRVPALRGCYTQGETLEEAEVNAKEAIELYLESEEFSKDQVDIHGTKTR